MISGNKIRLATKGLILVMVPLLVQLILLVLVFASLRTTEQHVNTLIASKNVALATSQLLKKLSDAQSDLCDYCLTKSLNFSNHFPLMEQAIQSDLDRLRALETNARPDSAEIGALSVYAKSSLSLLRHADLAIHQNPEALAEEEAYAAYREMAKLQQAALKLSVTETDSQSAGVGPSSQYVQWLLLPAAALNIILAYMLSQFFGRQIVARLNTVSQNAVKLSSGKALSPKLAGSDEIAALDSVFHQMADAIAEMARKKESIVNNAAEIICSLDAQGKFTEINPAVEQVLGYSPAALLGQRYLALVEPEDLARAAASLQHAVGSNDKATFESTMVASSGAKTVLLWSCSWSAAEQSLICVGSDITEKKQLERAKRDFLAMISHDLGSPLTALQGTLQLMDSGVYGNLNERGTKRLKVSLTNLDQLLRLVKDLVFLQRMETDQLQLDCAEVSILHLIERSVEMVHAIAEANHVKIEIAAGGDWLNCDADRIIQVLVNLLSNALKFSPPDSVVIVDSSLNDNSIIVKVKDSGPGVPESEKEKIFERYHQVDRRRAQEKRGTGLGLSISKQIVEQHGGKIGIDSVLGGGSCFWFTLPATSPK